MDIFNFILLLFFFVFHELKFQIIIICLHIILIEQTLIKFSVLNEVVHVFFSLLFYALFANFFTDCMYLLIILFVCTYRNTNPKQEVQYK